MCRSWTLPPEASLAAAVGSGQVFWIFICGWPQEVGVRVERGGGEGGSAPIPLIMAPDAQLRRGGFCNVMPAVSHELGTERVMEFRHIDQGTRTRLIATFDLADLC